MSGMVTIYTSGKSHVVTNLTETGELKITGLGLKWMNNFWGETVIDGVTIILTVNYCNNTVNIQEQYYFTMDYDGETQPPYSIRGSGTIDLSGAYPINNSV